MSYDSEKILAKMDAALTASFFCSATYENILESEGFPHTSEPIWILGSKYNLLHDRSKLEEDIKSLLLFTYRRGFGAIGGTGPTTDVGWGCMLRCGQMLLAQALVNRHLGRAWRLKPGHLDPVYARILRMFLDRRDSCFSIHQIASMGVSEGKAVGEWFGPNTVAQVLRKLAVYDEWSSLAIHVAMDNCIIADDIREVCSSDTPVPNVCTVLSQPYTTSRESLSEVCNCNCPSSSKAVGVSAAGKEVRCSCHCHVSLTAGSEQRYWRPLLLIIPMRLGLADINPIYCNVIKKCFTLKQSVGIIGGKPNNAYWFIGYNENRLFYFDPHDVQPCVDIISELDEADYTFHCTHPYSMDILQLDPSIAVGFYCGSKEDFEDLCHNMRKLTVDETRPTPLFEIHAKRPAHFPPFRPYNPSAAAAAATGEATAADFTVLEEPRVMDSDDEFEILL